MRIPEPPWEGDKIILRTFTESDITPSYLSWLNDPDVLRYSNQRFRNHSYESCLNYLRTFTDSADKFLLIQDHFSRIPLGTLTIYMNLHHRTADIGLMVGDKESWGRGIGFDAFYTAVNLLTNSGEVRKITAGALAINKGMVRVLEKAGLIMEATRRGQELVDGKPVDIVYYAKFCYA
jgi:[ribosomal protein S5]-alanine N-acetyltransferase